MTAVWDAASPGVVVLPSGRAIRGRGLRQPLPPGPVPDFAVYLLSGEPPKTSWPQAWLRWRDFGLPADVEAAREALLDAWVRSAHLRVEVGCGGGRGRTGTALACLAVIDGSARRIPFGTSGSATTAAPWRHRGSAASWRAS